MLRLSDSSELKEAAALIGAIVEETQADVASPLARGERLRRLLERVCERAQFSGAAVADSHGLPLASHAFPYSAEATGALAAVMGEVLAKFRSVTANKNASSVSIDVSYADKLVARRFESDEATYFVLALCSQEQDERDELELSVDEIRAIVRKD